MLKLAIQDLWDASDLKKKSRCTSTGAHVLKLANVTTNPCGTFITDAKRHTIMRKKKILATFNT